MQDRLAFPSFGPQGDIVPFGADGGDGASPVSKKARVATHGPSRRSFESGRACFRALSDCSVLEGDGGASLAEGN
jgi:hypothetical protein